MTPVTGSFWGALELRVRRFGIGVFSLVVLGILLAGLAALSSLMAGHHANEAMMSQIESSDQWSFFQSKGIKEAALTSKAENNNSSVITIGFFIFLILINIKYCRI